MSLKILLFDNISIIFFLDLVPPCTEIPGDLFKTTKSSLGNAGFTDKEREELKQMMREVLNE